MAALHEAPSFGSNQASQVSVMVSSVADLGTESANQEVMGTSVRETAGAHAAQQSHVGCRACSESLLLATNVVGSGLEPGPKTGHQWVRVCGSTVEAVSESRVTGVHNACLLMYAIA